MVQRHECDVPLRHKPVAHAPDGDDVLRGTGVILDLTAQAVDIDHDGVIIHSAPVAPHLIVDHILGEHLLGVAHKEQQQAALLFREVQLLVVLIEAHGGGIAQEGPAADLMAALVGEALAPADQRLDLGTQNLGPEGLGDVVVRAQREPVHEVVVLTAAADDDDRGGDTVAADGLDDIKALHIPQRDVHQDHIQCIALPCNEVQSCRAAVGHNGFHLVADHNFG